MPGIDAERKRLSCAHTRLFEMFSTLGLRGDALPPFAGDWRRSAV